MKSSDLKEQAWILLAITSGLFAVWQRSVFAGLWFIATVLLIGTTVTGWAIWYTKELPVESRTNGYWSQKERK